MSAKTKALVLFTVVALAAVAGSLIYTAQSNVLANSNNTVESDSESTPIAVTAPDNNSTGFMGFRDNGMMMGNGMIMERGFGGGMGHHSGMPHGDIAQIQVSDEYIANVTNIAKNDSDITNLINQGYNITAVHPVLSTTIDGNGNLSTKASTAEVLLAGSNGRALVIVNLDQAKVTKITTLTITEINKP